MIVVKCCYDMTCDVNVWPFRVDRCRMTKAELLGDYDKLWCNNLIGELMKWPLTHPFRIPVDPERDGAPQYLKIIKHPMDLSTVKKKLNDGVYKNVQSFIDDLHLITSNAIQFNGETSMYAYIASDIKNWIDEQYKDKPLSQEDEWQKRLETVVARLKNHIANAPKSLSVK